MILLFITPIVAIPRALAIAHTVPKRIDKYQAIDESMNEREVGKRGRGGGGGTGNAAH